ncbi:MAG: glycosyltransferase [Bacteroidales bacterium]|nr:glycosyltransferase [Bacteroidales bacterium]
MVPISAVIISFNEERNIGRCLESLDNLVDEVLVVDSFSTDRTEEICRRYKVRFIRHEFESHIQQKNWALNKADNDYILSLDADEALTPKLRESISDAAENWSYDGYYLNRKTSYSNSRNPRDVPYTEKKIRLWDRRKGVWGGINPHDTVMMDADATIGSLKGDMLHYSFFTIEAHRKKAEYFSSISAKALFTSGIRSNWLKITGSAAWKFIKSYFIRLGIQDGIHGFKISYNSAYGAWLKYRKLKSLNSDKDLDIAPSLCFFNTNKNWGGGEKWTLTVAMEMKSRGYKVVIIAYRDSELLRRSLQAGINAIGLKMRTSSFLNPVLLMRLKRIYRANNVKTLFLNLSIDLKTGARVARSCNVEKIIYRRGLAKPIRLSRRNKMLLTDIVTDIIAISETTKKGIMLNYKDVLDPDKVHIIYNGVDLPEIQNGINNKRKIIIGAAGRVSAEKGFTKLVELGKSLVMKGVDFNISLAGDGVQLKEIKDRVIEAGLEDKFSFPGFVKDMSEFYRSISLFVLTSESEGFGTVMIESMSYAKPVISFDIGSPSEIIDNGVNGYIVEDKNIELMADKISILYKNPSLLNRLGQKARETVERDFSLTRHFDELEMLIKK